MDIHVLCIKWGSKFSAEYVVKLRNMVQRNLSYAHRFICLTDDESELQPEIETLPLARSDLEYCWNKLLLFGSLPLTGTALYFDLDVVITGDIDCLIEYRSDAPFMSIKNWGLFAAPQFNSSVIRFTPNNYTPVLDDFIAKRAAGELRELREWDAYLGSRDRVVYWEGERRYGGDQEWISNRLFSQQQLAQHCYPSGWICSYKRHGQNLPADCRVMVFHGNPKMSDPDVTESWVAEHWR